VLVLLAWSAPYLLSTGPGTALVVGIVNSRIKGSIAIEDLSLRWLGPIRVGGLKLLDEDRRVVLQVREISYGGGVWRAMTDAQRFTELNIDRPRVALYLDEEGRVSLAAAIELRRPGPPRPPGPLPEPAGRINLRDGSVRVIRRDGQAYETRSIHGQWNLDTLAKLSGRIEAEAGDGGRIVLSADLSNLLTEGRFSLRGAEGELHLETDRAIALGPLTELLGAGPRVQAATTVRADANVGQSKLRLAFHVAAAGLRSADTQRRGIRPVDLGLVGNIATDGERLDGDVELTGDAGSLKAAFSHLLGGPAPALPLESIIAAAFGGEPISLPDFSLDASGNVDLPRLAQAVPGVLGVLPDVTITDGSVLVQNVSIRGGQAPSLKARCALSGLRARKAGRELTCEPISVAADATLAGESGLRIGQLALTSAFARAAAGGTASDLTGSFRLDLAAVREKLGTIFDLGALPEAGTVSGTLRLVGRPETQVDFDLDATVQDLRYAAGDRIFQVQRADLQQEGSLLLERRRPVEAVLTAGRIAMDEDVSATTSGTFRFAEGSFRFDLDLLDAKLRSLARRARAMKITAARDIAGSLRLKATAERSASGALSVALSDGKLRGLQLLEDARTGEAASPGGAIDLDFSARFAIAADRVSGEADIDGPAARLAASFFYERSDRPLRLNPEDVVTAFREGKPLVLPDLRLDAQGAADLAAIDRAMPSLLKPSPQAEITSGQVRLEQVSVLGGEAPRAVVRVRADGIQSKIGNKTAAWKPVIVALDVAQETGKPLGVREASIRTGMGEVRLAGAAGRLEGDFRADLAAARVQAAQVTDIGDRTAAGTVSGTVSVHLPTNDRIEFILTAAGRELDYRSNGADAHMDAAALSGAGHLTLRQGRPHKLAAERIDFALGEEISMIASGSYGFDAGGFSGDVHLTRAELGPLLARLRRLGLVGDSQAKCSGRLEVQARASRLSRDAPITSSGSGSLAGLTVDGSELGKRESRFEWSGVKVAGGLRQIDVALAKLTGELARAEVKNARLALGDQPSATGEVTVTADLGGCVEAARPLANWKETPAIAGRLHWTANGTASGKRSTIVGQGTIEGLRAGSGEESFQREKLSFRHSAVIHGEQDALTLTELRLDAPELFSLQLAGDVRELSARRVLGLSGSYEGKLESIVALARQLWPRRLDGISFRGQTRGLLEITGPARQPRVRPVFRGVAASTDFGWSGGEVFGTRLGEAKFAVKLADGQVTLPVEVIEAAEGKVRLGGVVDLRQGHAVFRLAGRHNVLEGLRITPRMKEELLGRINPVLAQATRVQGAISLELENLVLPLSRENLTDGTGRGHLDLSELNVQPAGILEVLTQLAKLAPGLTPAKVSGVDFRIRNGRVEYEDFTVVFPERFDLRFYGSVGFDDTLDMGVSVPISFGLLERLGVRGRIVDTVRVLEGVRVRIPIAGTRLKPRLDFSKVDLGALIRRAAAALLAERAADLARDAAKDDAKKPKDGRPEQPREDQKDGKPRGSLLDSILDVLRGGSERKESGNGSRP
jgi:hypothetical protein